LAAKRKSLVSAILKAFDSLFDMIGHYLRELAVLIVVFIPLDLWKHDEITLTRMSWVISASAVVFAFGAAFQWLAYLVEWARDIWRKEETA
jgi:hypothetical protein